MGGSVYGDGAEDGEGLGARDVRLDPLQGDAEDAREKGREVGVLQFEEGV